MSHGKETHLCFILTLFDLMLIANFFFLCSGVSGLTENIRQTILKKLDSPIQNEEIGGMPSLS
jgi:hypothetical protein